MNLKSSPVPVIMTKGSVGLFPLETMLEYDNDLGCICESRLVVLTTTFWVIFEQQSVSQNFGSRNDI